MEAPPGFEPGVKDLQSHALPLGYGAIVRRRSLRCSFRRRAVPSAKSSATLPPPSSQIQNERFEFVQGCGASRYINFCSFRNRKIGAGDEARTRYLHLGKVALYRMSYARINYVAGLPCHHRAETLDDEQVGDESPPDAIWWCLRSESNQRHADFQSAALPSELQRHIYLVGTTGLEPVTPCL